MVDEQIHPVFAELEHHNFWGDCCYQLSCVVARLPRDVGKAKNVHLNGCALDRNLDLCNILAQMLWDTCDEGSCVCLGVSAEGNCLC